MKEWDQRRAQRLIIHRRVSDEIDYALQNRLTESDDFLKVVLQFLQDSEEQKVEANRCRKNMKINMSETHSIDSKLTL